MICSKIALIVVGIMLFTAVPNEVVQYNATNSYTIVHPKQAGAADGFNAVFFAGGGFTSTDIETFRNHAEIFSSQGGTSILVDYSTVSDPVIAFNDAEAALLAIAQRFGNNNFLVGESVGGSLAATLGARHPDKTAGIILFAPVTDLNPIWPNTAKISPINNIPTAPVRMYYGSLDATSDWRAYFSAVPNISIYVVDGGGHDIFHDEPLLYDSVTDMILWMGGQI